MAERQRIPLTKDALSRAGHIRGRGPRGDWMTGDMYWIDVEEVATIPPPACSDCDRPSVALLYRYFHGEGYARPVCEAHAANDHYPMAELDGDQWWYLGEPAGTTM